MMAVGSAASTRGSPDTVGRGIDARIAGHGGAAQRGADSIEERLGARQVVEGVEQATEVERGLGNRAVRLGGQ